VEEGNESVNVEAWRGNREACECERRKETRVSMWWRGEETEKPMSVRGGRKRECQCGGMERKPRV